MPGGGALTAEGEEVVNQKVQMKMFDRRLLQSESKSAAVLP